MKIIDESQIDITLPQLELICSLIDEWHMEWKSRITEEFIPHRLGLAKEDLKHKFYYKLKLNERD